MKLGVRKPSIKKSISAKTKGKITRYTKKSINPIYGKKGIGIINDPKKAIYNKVYSKSTVGINHLINPSNNTMFNSISHNNKENNYKYSVKTEISISEKKKLKISKLKRRQFWLNLAGYFIIIPFSFNVLIDPVYFFECIIDEPEILPIILLILSPAIFSIYKAKIYKKEIIGLEEEVTKSQEKIDTHLKNCEISINIIDDIFNESLLVNPNEVLSKDELIDKISNENEKCLNYINGIITSVKIQNYTNIEQYISKLVLNMKSISVCCDKLFNMINNDDLTLTHIEAIQYSIDTLKLDIKILVTQINIIISAFELNQNYTDEITQFTSRIKSILKKYEEINEEISFIK